MNKLNIRWIIVFMVIAVIGLIAIQVYWLNYYVTLNEKKFDSTVFEVLRQVKADIESYDEQQHRTYSRLLKQTRMEGTVRSKFDMGQFGTLHDTAVLYNIDETFRNAWLDYQRATNKMDIAQRISAAKLDAFLKTSITNNAIPIRYDYGIYSNDVQDFVIMNGHYVTPVGDEIQASSGEAPSDRMNANLRNSKYAISLFNGEYNVPGALIIHFPDRITHIWSNLIPMLLLTVLFIAIILIAFSYSVNVIIKQKKISEMKNDFINNMTHEFKTPIATISLATDSIMNDKIAGDKDKVGRFAKIIKQENGRMLGQVEKVLQMAQLDKNKIEFKWEVVDLHDIILKARENFDLTIEERDGDLTLSLQAQNALLRADENHLSNVIHNLLDNANKYSPDAPHILIQTRNTKDGIELSIQDHGQGMSSEVRKHIFDKFYREHTGNRHDVKGFGLGLSYVKAIVQAHDGRIKVLSEVGEGSTFVITLPNAKD